MKVNDNSQKINQVLGFLKGQLYVVDSYFTSYVKMHNGMAEYQTVANHYPGFFYVCRSALLCQWAINLAKIYDRGSDLSLWKLSCLLSQYRTTDKNGDALSKRINGLLEERADILKLLKELRDNDLAHNGKELLENEDTFARVEITIGNYKSLIYVAYTILNEVDVFLNNNCFVLNLETEIDRLFSTLDKNMI